MNYLTKKLGEFKRVNLPWVSTMKPNKRKERRQDRRKEGSGGRRGKMIGGQEEEKTCRNVNYWKYLTFDIKWLVRHSNWFNAQRYPTFNMVILNPSCSALNFLPNISYFREWLQYPFYCSGQNSQCPSWFLHLFLGKVSKIIPGTIKYPKSSYAFSFYQHISNPGPRPFAYGSLQVAAAAFSKIICF